MLIQLLVLIMLPSIVPTLLLVSSFGGNKHFSAKCCLSLRKPNTFNHRSKIAIMKKIILTLLFLAPFLVFAQALKEYHASNGRTYHPGDTIKLGLGSMPDGNFKYIQINQYCQVRLIRGEAMPWLLEKICRT